VFDESLCHLTESPIITTPFLFQMAHPICPSSAAIFPVHIVQREEAVSSEGEKDRNSEENAVPGYGGPALPWGSIVARKGGIKGCGAP
jgi:hypothetical protein